jgi:hypothetical protein
MATRLRLTISYRFRWWVPILVDVAKVNALVGIPVDPQRVTDIVVKYGIKFIVKAE